MRPDGARADRASLERVSRGRIRMGCLEAMSLTKLGMVSGVPREVWAGGRSSSEYWSLENSSDELDICNEWMSGLSFFSLSFIFSFSLSLSFLSVIFNLFKMLKLLLFDYFLY